jgi:hypothetical protein
VSCCTTRPSAFETIVCAKTRISFFISSIPLDEMAERIVSTRSLSSSIKGMPGTPIIVTRCLLVIFLHDSDALITEKLHHCEWVNRGSWNTCSKSMTSRKTKRIQDPEEYSWFVCYEEQRARAIYDRNNIRRQGSLVLVWER